MRLNALFCGTLAAALLLTGAGCGSKVKPVRVEGVVLLDDRPLKEAMVTFVPEEGSGRLAAGLTDDDGKFELTTATSGDGALPGNYKVTVAVAPPPKPDAVVITKYPPSNEDWKRMIMAGKRGAQRHPQQNPPKTPNMPKAVYRDPAKTPLKCEVPTEGKVTFKVRSDRGK
jgi:hypothetical protein